MEKQAKLESVVSVIMAGLSGLAAALAGNKPFQAAVTAGREYCKGNPDKWLDIKTAIKKARADIKETDREKKQFADRLCYFRAQVGIRARKRTAGNPAGKPAGKPAATVEGTTPAPAGELPEAGGVLTAPAERKQYARRLLSFFAEACGIEVSEAKKIMLETLK
jgi:hypothetical protein